MSLSTAVKSGQLQEDSASKITDWYTGIIQAQTQLLQLNREHLVKSLEEFSHMSKDSPNNIMQNHTEYLTQANITQANLYSATVQTAQDLLLQGMVAFKQNSKPVVDAAAEVIKKSRTKTTK